jgi:hypothetical protein
MAYRERRHLRRKKLARRKSVPSISLQVETLESRVFPGSLLLSLPLGGALGNHHWGIHDGTVDASSEVGTGEHKRVGSQSPHAKPDVLESWLRSLSLELEGFRQRSTGQEAANQTYDRRFTRGKTTAVRQIAPNAATSPQISASKLAQACRACSERQKNPTLQRSLF